MNIYDTLIQYKKQALRVLRYIKTIEGNKVL